MLQTGILWESTEWVPLRVVGRDMPCFSASEVLLAVLVNLDCLYNHLRDPTLLMSVKGF